LERLGKTNGYSALDYVAPNVFTKVKPFNGEIMRVPAIYLETTIFNFPFADDAPHHQIDTLRLFDEIKSGKFRPFTSEYVTRELEAATDSRREDRLRLIKDYDVEVIPISDEAKSLATAYIEAGIIPPAYGTDGFHIAAATVKGLDFIVSLNFRHIVKRKTIEETELINFREGYKKIGIYSPAEVIDYDENL
jgi:rRNA-processing protein FCF1